MERFSDYNYGLTSSRQLGTERSESLHRVNGNLGRNADMPRQMVKSYYKPDQQKPQNRPLSRQLFHTGSKNLIKLPKQSSKLTTEQDLQTLRKKQASSLHQQILKLRQQVDRKKSPATPFKDQPITEATFKPHNYHHQIQFKIQSNIRKLFKQKLKIVKAQDRINKKQKNYLYKLKEPKTKYQKILSEFFGKDNRGKSHSKPKGVLYKTFQKKPFVSEKRIQQQAKRLQNIGQIQKNQAQDKKMKKCQSEGWMSMNFHQRQDRILKTRKDKQNWGKKQNLQKEIEKCTFRPEINKCNPNASKQFTSTYLEVYNEKIRRRY